MWSVFGTSPLGNISLRRIILALSAILMAVLVAATLNPALAQGQTVTVDGENEAAIWQGDSLSYGGVSLEKLSSPPNTNSQFDGTACEQAAIGYASFFTFEEDDNTSSIVICFNNEDRGNDVTANLLRFNDVSIPEEGEAVSFGTPNLESSVIVAAEGSTGLSSDLESEPATNCSSEHTYGLGWVVCPVTSFLAAGMDQLYEILTNFLIVSPISTDRDSALYYMWSVMQNIANILFIVGFLIIIYSQITSAGISNYGIKRLLPRLAIAAVLVNVSFWVCAFAVDLSNIFGVAITDMFKSIRDNIPSQANNDLGGWSWSALAGLALSGGASTIALTGVAAGVVASAGGTLWFIFVALTAVMLSALVAILVLAARQALITILIIISPLAFVAYLLPSTESYFDRWRSLFMTMLLVFPAFSVVFGGSQLAGLAIVHNADPSSPNYFHVIVLGMMVQVAPVIITPLLVKLSGSLIGRIAGIADNPNRGMLDEAKKFAQKRHDMTKNKRLWAPDPSNPKKYMHNDPLSRAGRRKAVKDISHDNLVKAYEGGAEAAYNRDGRSDEAHRVNEVNAMQKGIGEQESKRDFAREIAKNELYKEMDLGHRYVTKEAEQAEATNKNEYDRYAANPEIASDEGVALQNLATRIRQQDIEGRVIADRESGAERVLRENYHMEVAHDTNLQDRAGDTEVDSFGRIRVKSQSLSQVASASDERVKQYRATFAVENTKDADIFQLAIGNSAAGFEVNDEVREAAIQHVNDQGDVNNMINLTRQIDLSKDESKSVRRAFASTIKASPLRPRFVPVSWLGDKIPQGLDPSLPEDHGGKGDQLINFWVKDAVARHKYDVTGLSTTDLADIEFLNSMLADNSNGILPELMTTRNDSGDLVVDVLKGDIRRIFKDKDVYKTIGNRADPLRKLGRTVGITDPNDMRPDD